MKMLLKKKQTLLLTICSVLVLSSNALSQKETKEPYSYQLNINENEYTISEGDTVKIGYGSNPYGSFMYLLGGDDSLDKRYAGQTGVISKINYVKANNSYWVRIKIISLGKPSYVAQTNQLGAAIDKKEIVKIGDVEF